MKIVYHTLTGNVERFVKRAAFPSVRITPGLTVDEPYILVTPTVGFGDIPRQVSEFLAVNAVNMVAVAGGGNRNWGEKQYAMAGTKISAQYNVPLILRFEVSGTDADITKFNEEATLLAETYRTE